MATGAGLLNAVTTTVLLTNIVDKVATVFIAWAVVRVIPARTLANFSLGAQYVGQIVPKRYKPLIPQKPSVEAASAPSPVATVSEDLASSVSDEQV